jgi:hypothetical protein
MSEPQNKHQPGLTFTQSDTEPATRLPWVIAGVAVLAVVGLLLAFGGHGAPTAAIGSGPGLAPADAYASKLAIEHIQMSTATNFAGGKVTYVEGQITNKGDKTLAGVTVQVAFRNDLKEIAQKETLPLSVIRTREPYVDTQPMSVSPLKPGDRRDFRLVFDTVAADWNQQYPEVRVVQVSPTS